VFGRHDRNRGTEGLAAEARFLVDTILPGLPPLLAVPFGLLILLSAKQWARDQDAQEAAAPGQTDQAPTGAAPSSDCHNSPSAAPIVRW